MSDYCERPEFYNEERVTARKEHRCCECRRLIPIGTKYVRCTGKFDGDMFAEKQHEECRDFAAKVNLELIGECAIPFGEIDDAMKNPGEYGLDNLDPPDTIDTLRAEWAHIKTMHSGGEADDAIAHSQTTR